MSSYSVLTLTGVPSDALLAGAFEESAEPSRFG